MSINRFLESPEQSGGHYDTAQICLNGHLINGYAQESPEFNQPFCDQCGAKTIVACPSCGKSIRGEYHSLGILTVTEMHAPAYCLNCGIAFPWTRANLEAAKELADELNELSAEERIALRNAIDELVSDTPRTQVAIVRFKKIVPKAGKVAVEAFKKLLFDVATDAVKKQIWGS